MQIWVKQQSSFTLLSGPSIEAEQAFETGNSRGPPSQRACGKNLVVEDFLRPLLYESSNRSAARLSGCLLCTRQLSSERACCAQDNLFEWHFTIRGPEGTEFDGGVYHGRIVLPPDYPMKPPSIYFLTVSAAACCSPNWILAVCLYWSRTKWREPKVSQL